MVEKIPSAFDSSYHLILTTTYKVGTVIAVSLKIRKQAGEKKRLSNILRIKQPINSRFWIQI